MKKASHKNQIIITALAVMIVVAILMLPSSRAVVAEILLPGDPEVTASALASFFRKRRTRVSTSSRKTDLSGLINAFGASSKTVSSKKRAGSNSATGGGQMGVLRAQADRVRSKSIPRA